MDIETIEKPLMIILILAIFWSGFIGGIWGGSIAVVALITEWWLLSNIRETEIERAKQDALDEIQQAKKEAITEAKNWELML